MPPGYDPVPPTPAPADSADSVSLPRELLSATSDRFLRNFVRIWTLGGVLMLLFYWLVMPHVQYTAWVIVGTGTLAWLAVGAGRMRLARYVIIVPGVLTAAVAPWLLNGIRTPILANIPSLILLCGWALGQRAIAWVGGFFVASAGLIWLAEAQGWWQMSTPLRTPEVWAMVWTFSTAVTGVVLWHLIGNTQAVHGAQQELNRRLQSASNFNETILLNSPLPMGVYASDGQCLAANEAYASLVGATRQQLLGQNFNHIGEWQRAGLVGDCQAALAQRRAQQRETQVVTSFGRHLWLDCRILPVDHGGDCHLLAQFVDLTERKRLEMELRMLAFNDALTQLPNRRLLLDRLKHALQSSQRQGSHGAVLFLDLNEFKPLNDKHGHEVGDQMLVEVARRLRRLVRGSDTVARLGGDEFVVLLEGLGADAGQADAYVAAVSAKIGLALAEPYVLGEIRHSGSVSVGGKLFCGHGLDPDEILKAADAAMYEAKRARPAEQGRAAEPGAAARLVNGA